MDPIRLLLIAVIVLGVLGGLIYYGRREDEDRDPLQERLAQYGDRELPASLEDLELSLPFTERIVRPIFQWLAMRVTKYAPQQQIEDTQHKLMLAGNPSNLDATTFMGLRVGATIAFVFLTFVLVFVLTHQPLAQALLFTAGAGVLGFFLPQLWLSSQIDRRKDSIIKALPDALDLLTICVEAGLGFDSAMGKVYEKWDNDLAIEFGRALQEVQLGKIRREALKDMSERMDVDDVTAFVAAINQADQLGVSMAKILRVQSDQMRVKRRQRAQEKAQQAPVKMMIPMVLLIFPSIWIVLLGPSIIVIMESGIGAVF